MAESTAAEGVKRAIARLHEAMNRVVAGDVSAIKSLHSHRDDVTGFYGWGAYEKGWAAVGRRWDWAGEQFRGGGPVTYETLSTVVSGELAYTTEIETIRVRLEGLDRPTEWSNRVTHVFRLEDGEWRLVHRHANRLEPRYTPSSRLR
jgi:ketosteroid isomerase-like protein